MQKGNDMLLQQLDSIIANHQTLVKEKEIRIDGLRRTLGNARSDADRLALCRQLYDEYLVFDADSALRYANESERIVTKSMPKDYDQITYWKLNKAFIYTVQGLYDATIKLLQTIDSSKLSPEMKSMYFGSMSYLYSLRSIYLQSNKEMWRDEVRKANEYRDSIQAQNLPQSPEWLWIPIAAALDSEYCDMSSIDISALKNIVDNSRGASRQNAINSYWLARYYEATGDMESMVKYKTKAAINDALIVNREIAAIQELASYLFEKGDLNRAYNYLLYNLDQANIYHNRYRIVNLSDVLPTVRNAYRDELEKRDRRLLTLVVILAVLSIVLLGSIFFIVFEFNKLKKMRNLLKDANNELRESVKERDRAITGLEKANTELNEANKQKLGLLAYAFKLTTQYINALEDYRKKLLKKYKVKCIDDLGVLINDPELIKEQYQGFYEGFDKTVLSIFPDFIKEYNSTVGEDSAFSAETIAKTKTLNTKLRIYALRRLGISKSAEIAEMLNVSIRTVYNNRSVSAPEEEEARRPK
ncbi:MAG: hypothetical protein K2H75_04045 [Muribaculaceae bacterium]|nr:hypothetical protein [Muribaculaceae bacterium]